MEDDTDLEAGARQVVFDSAAYRVGEAAASRDAEVEDRDTRVDGGKVEGNQVLTDEQEQLQDQEHFRWQLDQEGHEEQVEEDRKSELVPFDPEQEGVERLGDGVEGHDGADNTLKLEFEVARLRALLAKHGIDATSGAKTRDLEDTVLTLRTEKKVAALINSYARLASCVRRKETRSLRLSLYAWKERTRREHLIEQVIVNARRKRNLARLRVRFVHLRTVLERKKRVRAVIRKQIHMTRKRRLERSIKEWKIMCRRRADNVIKARIFSEKRSRKIVTKVFSYIAKRVSSD